MPVPIHIRYVHWRPGREITFVGTCRLEWYFAQQVWSSAFVTGDDYFTERQISLKRPIYYPAVPFH
jgi:hypothetical protein